MPATERLYYDNSHLIEFEARVVETSERVSGWTAVTLDRTAFYPTGGGQPSDTGTLDGRRVVECIDDEKNCVLHIIQGQPPAVGELVKGRVDWLRRLDHIQQHTAQHILSQAFVTLFNAPTKGFRVFADYCEIDVQLNNPGNEVIERAVELANNVIWEDRLITIKTVSAEEAANLQLRKEPSRSGDLRLIEIAGFDLTPCGGTHAFRTGEVGMIAVRHWERAKGMTRIEFIAGMRALADYRRVNQTARNVAALFSGARDDGPHLAAQMLEENKELHRRVRALEEIEARLEAEELLREWTASCRVDADPAASKSSLRVISKIFADRDAESLKRLALALIAHPQTIALLGSRDNETARVVFAKSADAAGDMNALIKEACAVLDGRGGGKPDLAQGGGKNVERLPEAIELASSLLRTR